MPALYGAADPLASLPDTAKVKLLERLEGFARAEDPRVAEVMAHIAGVYEVVLVARSDGHLAADVRPLVRVSVTVIMEEQGPPRAGLLGRRRPLRLRLFHRRRCCATMRSRRCTRRA
jgi:TldD protein